MPPAEGTDLPAAEITVNLIPKRMDSYEQIEYKYPGMYACDGQDVLYNITEMFDIEHSAEDIDTNDFDIERSELRLLRRHIVEQDDTSLQHAETFYAEPEKINLSRKRFIAVLGRLINDSDRSDRFVHVS